MRVALAATRRAVYAVFDGDGMESVSSGPHLPVAHVVTGERHPVGALGDHDAGRDRTGRSVWGVAGDTVYKVEPILGYVDQAVHRVPIPTIEDDETWPETNSRVWRSARTPSG